MKKILSILMMIMIGLTLAGCGGSTDENTETPQENASVSTVHPTGDLDLTQLSSTMIYSEVYNMMYEPEEYIGRNVRMKGLFNVYSSVDEEGNMNMDQTYFACIISDATACCS